MSILVKGMEMPKRCGGCFLRVGECKQRIYMEDRPHDCPLVPVPPHGRLIDADALDWVEGRDEQDRPVYLLLKIQIDDIPTIIEAEEGET